jgi:hypothetical protein
MAVAVRGHSWLTPTVRAASCQSAVLHASAGESAAPSAPAKEEAEDETSGAKADEKRGKGQRVLHHVAPLISERSFVAWNHFAHGDKAGNGDR